MTPTTSSSAPRSAGGLSREEVRRRTNRFANVLRFQCGLGKGDRLFIVSDCAPDVEMAKAGASKAGLEVRVLATDMNADELRTRLASGKANAVLTTLELFESKVEDGVPGVATLHHILIAGEPLDALMDSVPDEFGAEMA